VCGEELRQSNRIEERKRISYVNRPSARTSLPGKNKEAIWRNAPPSESRKKRNGPAVDETMEKRPLRLYERRREGRAAKFTVGGLLGDRMDESRDRTDIEGAKKKNLIGWVLSDWGGIQAMTGEGGREGNFGGYLRKKGGGGINVAVEKSKDQIENFQVTDRKKRICLHKEGDHAFERKKERLLWDTNNGSKSKKDIVRKAGGKRGSARSHHLRLGRGLRGKGFRKGKIAKAFVGEQRMGRAGNRSKKKGDHSLVHANNVEADRRLLTEAKKGS